VPAVPKTLSGKIRRIELRQQEIDAQGKDSSQEKTEYFYWDFPELKSKKK
jgi:acetyl-CoA synthetase/4-hydroxybutyrate---CoA ligase (AMP-forming)